MKKTRILISMTVASLLLAGTYTTAFADVDAFTVKDAKSNAIRQYNKGDIISSFKNSRLGKGNDLLFKDFNANKEANGIYSMHDDSKKYVSYETALDELLSAASEGQAFDLNTFAKETEAAETPNYVYDRKVKTDKVINGLTVTKDGFELDLAKEKLEDYEDVKVVAGKVTVANGTVKGKLVVDAGKASEVTVKNVKADAVTGLSGSLKLQAVEAKELTIEKALSLNVDATSKVTKLVITAPKGSEIVLSGNLGVVELNSAVNLKLADGTKVQIKAIGDAKDAKITAGKGVQAVIEGKVGAVDGDGATGVKEGTVTQPTNPGTTNPGTTNPGTGTGGYTPPATVDHSALYTSINNIFTAINNLDNKFGSGYLGISTSGNSATVTLPADKTAKEILVDLKAGSTTLADAMTLDEYKNLVKAIKTDAGVNTGALISVLAEKMNAIKPGLYNSELRLIQNLANLANETNKAALVDNFDKLTLGEDIVISGYKVTSIKVKENTTNTEVYNNTNKTITKANLKKALGDKTYEEAASTDIDDLLSGKTIEITLEKNGNTTTYNISFARSN